MFTVFIVASDTSIGRFNKSMLSQKLILDLLIDKIENPEKLSESEKDPLEVSEIAGVTLNDKNDILEIEWSYMDLRGSLDFLWLPLTIQKFQLRNDIFSVEFIIGPLDLTDLPETLKYIDVSGNRLEGEVSLTALPDQMAHVNISNNRLGGLLDLEQLPSTLEILRLSKNNFMGVTDFTKLPKSLIELNISQNPYLKGLIHVDEGALTCKVKGSKVEKIVLNE